MLKGSIFGTDVELVAQASNTRALALAKCCSLSRCECITEYIHKIHFLDKSLWWFDLIVFSNKCFCCYCRHFQWDKNWKCRKAQVTLTVHNFSKNYSRTFEMSAKMSLHTYRIEKTNEGFLNYNCSEVGNQRSK